MAAAGDKIGGFTLVRELGVGGMGATWEAIRRREHGFEQRVAVKLANPSVLNTPEGLELFRREASLAASLRHPNIAAVLDIDERQGYLIYELVDGADFRSVLRETPQGKLPYPLLVYVMAQIARALAHAHKRVLHGRLSPVVHRDMSPGNIVVDYDGNLKVVDFGIAKAIALSDRSETIKGKLSYMAPEQAMGTEVDGRVDQYALGVIAYEAITGVRPNDGQHDGETLSRILSGQHVPVTKRAPDIPAGLGEIIERMLQTKVEDRFPDMEALIDALTAFNPALTIHRELAGLVQRANPPRTIVLQNGAFVSVPVPAQAPAPARQALARTLAGPILGVPPAPMPPPQQLPPASVRPVATGPSASGRPRITLSPTETIDPRPEGGLTPGEMAHAHTMIAPQGRAPRISPTIEESGSFSPPPSRWRVPALGAAGALLLGVIAWAMLSDGGRGAMASPGTDAAPTGAPTAGTNTAPPANTMQPAPSTPTVPTTPTAPIANPIDPSALAQAVTTPPVTTIAATPTTNLVPPPVGQPVSDKAREDDKSSSSTHSKHGARIKKGNASGEAPPAPSGSTSSERQARNAGTIRVKVFPWGRVWIDGKVRGSVPPILEAQVPAGTHEIAVGHETPMDTRKVTVAAGGSELVSFDLEGK